MEANNEKPIIFAVVTLFLTFTLVYLAFFREQGLPLFSTIEQNLTGNDATLTGTTTDDIDALLQDQDTSEWVDLTTTRQTGSISTGALSARTGGTISLPVTRPTTSVSNNRPATSLVLKDKIETVSGIVPWYNSIKIAEVLALDIQFAFVDTGSNQYGYLGTGNIDTINQIIKRLGGNIVAIETENDILKNSLRGDRILFINIPQVTLTRANGTEKRLLVAFVVEIGDDKRLIQSPVDRYYSSKQRMKLIFESIYGKFL